MSLCICLFVALIDVVSADQCKKPTPVGNFTLEKFSGTWYQVGYYSMNTEIVDNYETATCGVIHFNFDNGEDGQNDWNVDLIISQTSFEMEGTYYLPDPTKGLMKIFYTTLNITYDFTITCTDYSSYVVAYACVQLGPEETFGIQFFFIRDLEKNEEILLNEDLNRCFDSVKTKTLDELRKLPHNNCPANKHFS